jgi:hypothetical protein
VAVQPLRVLAEIEAVAEPDGQRAVREKSHPPAVVNGRVPRRTGGEQHLEIAQRVAVQSPTHDPRRVGAGGAVRQRQVNPAVVLVVGVDHDLEQAGLAAHVSLRHAATGASSNRPSSIILRRPARSVTSILPSGRKAIDHGWSNPSATMSMRYACAAAGPQTDTRMALISRRKAFIVIAGVNSTSVAATIADVTNDPSAGGAARRASDARSVAHR